VTEDMESNLLRARKTYPVTEVPRVPRVPKVTEMPEDRRTTNDERGTTKTSHFSISSMKEKNLAPPDPNFATATAEPTPYGGVARLPALKSRA